MSLDAGRVLLVCVPTFDHTHSGVLVNINTLQCIEVSCNVQVDNIHVLMATDDSLMASQEENMTVLEELESDEDDT